MTEAETAWIAGVIEGEGCISVGRTKGWTRAAVFVNMTDYDVIERLQKWSGVGTITVKAVLKNRKPSWAWSVCKQTEVLELLTTVYPYLCSRRQAKAQQAFELLKEKSDNGGFGRGRFHRAKTHCRNGHVFSEENTYISKRGCRACRICRREGVARWKQKDPEHAKALFRASMKRFRERQKAKQ